MRTPEPLVLPAVPRFLGQWSQVAVGIGTPPQWLAMLSATAGSELWAITPPGCNATITSLVPNCTAARGNLFHANESSTLTVDATERIPNTDYFFPEIRSYVTDMVTLNASNSTGVDVVLSFRSQTIALFNGTSFWWGMLGLGQKAVALQDPENHPSLLTSLKDAGAIRSLSYGFTAGAYYDASPANLVLGGYDPEAVEMNNVTFDVNDSSGDRALTLSVTGLEIAKTLNGTISLLGDETGGDIAVAIDSMLPALWLPAAICDALASALDLAYDTATDLYVVASPATLRNLNPQFKFTLAANGTSSETVTVDFEYEAFEHSQGPPTYNESYVVVDWERGTFGVGQATHRRSHGGIGAVAISPLGDEVGNGEGLSGRGIAGVVVGVVVAGVLVAGGLFFFWRTRRIGEFREMSETTAVGATVEGEGTRQGRLPAAEILGRSLYEVVGGDDVRENAAGGGEGAAKAAAPAAELESPNKRHEMEA